MARFSLFVLATLVNTFSSSPEGVASLKLTLRHRSIFSPEQIAKLSENIGYVQSALFPCFKRSKSGPRVLRGVSKTSSVAIAAPNVDVPYAASHEVNSAPTSENADVETSDVPAGEHDDPVRASSPKKERNALEDVGATAFRVNLGPLMALQPGEKNQRLQSLSIVLDDGGIF